MQVLLDFKSKEKELLDDVKIIYFDKDNTFITLFHLDQYRSIKVKELNLLAYSTLGNGVEFINYENKEKQ